MSSRYTALARIAVTLALSLVAGTAAAALLTGRLEVRGEPDRLDGEYVLGEDLASFLAEQREDGRVEARITVNGIAFDAIFDPAGPEVRLDGGGQRLPAPERAVLRSLVSELERRWQPSRQTLTDPERTVFRLVLLLSDAPASFVFSAMTVRPNGAGSGGPAGAPIPGGCEDQDDGDNTYIDCPPHVGEVCYDACPIHGFLCEDANLGCDQTNECLGRCGAGCSSDGSGAYRQDCADHDACCRRHGDCLNPLDAECGDEYFEAADDFLFAEPNCTDCLDDCVMRLTVERELLWPGEELAFEIYLSHRRPDTVRQAFRIRLVAPDGRVVALRTTDEREISQGDELRVRESLLLPVDLSAGRYELIVGMEGMEQGRAVRSVIVTVEE